MSEILYQLHLSPESGLDGLVAVHKKQLADISLAEQRVLHETRKISNDIDFVFFRRFPETDVRTSQPVAYIIDNTSGKLDNGKLARLHHALWLNGTVPLLYADNADSVDILSCVAGPSAEEIRNLKYSPLDKIYKDAKNISDQIKRFSAFCLADGTFWENDLNKSYTDRKNSAHNVLLEKIKQADKEISGTTRHFARLLLLLTILVKYLEDRGVFKVRKDFFSQYAVGANSFYEVLCNGTPESIGELFKCLESRFGGDVFTLKENGKTGNRIKKLMKEIADAVQAATDRDGRLYFWGVYNFNYIPAEVISHVYQYFTQKKKTAGFTPVMLVNLMLDQVMALGDLNGGEKIFDPACDSGIFLVSAFRRLVFVNQQRKNRSLDAQELIELLRTTIYGIELRGEDAYITKLCLFIAVCDALQPEIIWEKLNFYNLIENNIFIGDISKRGKNVLASCNASKSRRGFDVIVGNPPFVESLPKAEIKDLKKARKNILLNQLPYYVLISCAGRYLCENGKLCMVQSYGFLYNSNTASMRSDFFDEFTVNKILDFVSVSGLFENESTKSVVIQLTKKRPRDNHNIIHLTFRGTISIDEKICFDPNHYDYHYVSQKEAVDKMFIWNVNLLGGGRLKQLARHLKAVPDLNDFIKLNKWSVQDGLKSCKNAAKTKQDDWLYNKPLLTSDVVSGRCIDKQMLSTTNTGGIKAPKNESAFLPPMIIIQKLNSLEALFWDEGFLAYTDEFTGINVSGNNEKTDLEIFFKSFTENIQTLQACLLLLASGTLAGGKSVHTKDIMNLPWPQNGNFDLLPWETELLDDIRNYMDDYVKCSRTSKLLKNKATDNNLENYSQTFLRLINKSYPKMRIIKYVKNGDLVFMFFSFSEKDDPLPEIDSFNLEQMIESIGSTEYVKSLQTLRVVRIFSGNTLIIIKPDNLRYWIRSTAVRDVDDTIIDILKRKKYR
ncbi:MAG: SAM-dependent methyltransferase [Spirochaetaceae bacterium]|nr:SAM-dependent methyltransferase [Spirochaetaceae bacterium]